MSLSFIFKVETTLKISKLIEKHNVYLPTMNKLLTIFLVDKNLL